MLKSDSIASLAAALALAQAEIGSAKTSSENPFFKSKYADLTAVFEAYRPSFGKHGLSLVQFPVSDGERVGIENILMHKSGEWLAERLLLKPVKGDPQAAGSTITYARRYSASAIAGVSQEDDDGNQASRSHQSSNQNVSQKTTDEAPVIEFGGEFDPIYYEGSQSQKAILMKTMMECKIKDVPTQIAIASEIMDAIPKIPLHALSAAVKKTKAFQDHKNAN